jgi:hypothetical protein
MKRLLSGFRGIASVMFATLLFIIPVALLASVRPVLLAAISGGLGGLFLLGSLFPIPRIHTARVLGKGLLAAAVILAIIHVSGLLEPLYRRDGWLLLGMETDVYPLQVNPGDILTYTMATTSDDMRPAMARSYVVNDAPHKGMLLYSFLPTLNGIGFPITGSPVAEVIPWAESQNDQETIYTIVYAKLELPVLNSVNWSWSTTYTEGWDVIGVITSNGDTHTDLGAGENLSLQYSVIVPQDHPEGNIRSARAGLSYRDPMWSSYQIHELRFQFEGPVRVVRN